jgi:hypothetical protein
MPLPKDRRPASHRWPIDHDRAVASPYLAGRSATIVDGEPNLPPILNRILPDALVHSLAMQRNVPARPTIVFLQLCTQLFA